MPALTLGTPPVGQDNNSDAATIAHRRLLLCRLELGLFHGSLFHLFPQFHKRGSLLPKLPLRLLVFCVAPGGSHARTNRDAVKPGPGEGEGGSLTIYDASTVE